MSVSVYVATYRPIRKAIDAELTREVIEAIVDSGLLDRTSEMETHYIIPRPDMLAERLGDNEEWAKANPEAVKALQLLSKAYPEDEIAISW